MELGFVLMVCLSAAAGLALRRVMSRRVGRVLFGLGLVLLLSGVAVLVLVPLGAGRVIGFWTGSMAAVVLLSLAALVLPLGLAASWRRPS